MITSSLKILSHEVTTSEIKRSEDLAPKIGSDDEIFSLCALRCHTEIERVDVGLVDGNLRIPKLIAGTRSEIFCRQGGIHVGIITSIVQISSVIVAKYVLHVGIIVAHSCALHTEILVQFIDVSELLCDS